MTHRVVKLTIVNDFVCPNCCIGQHELLSAISYCKDTLNLPISFELEHMPFRLISKECLTDTEGAPKVDKSTFYSKQIGKEKFSSFENAISKWANEKGIPLSFRGVMSQSTRAHRLAIKASQMGGQQLQLPILVGLFKANLEDGKDIADVNVLADLATSIGMMSKDDAIKFLQSTELEREVNAMCEKARTIGITGVPMTIIDGKWAVSGGQSSDVYVQIFKKLAAAGIYSAPSPFPAPVVDTEICA
ncbi:thioredoxin-like protein [Collybia nuda]|uniref:Thioredoxin-like protein n=1 Tax=Collybia nuda TaxID=64659 RepID=A0A9P6CND3_9AGAR|nr:thioredoxin-like protein [Collybia nuda]